MIVLDQKKKLSLTESIFSDYCVFYMRTGMIILSLIKRSDKRNDYTILSAFRAILLHHSHAYFAVEIRG